MKLKTKRIIAVSAVAAVVLTGAIAALADQENNFDGPCDHSYEITAFEHNTVAAQCTICGEIEQYDFAEYVGAESTDSNFDELLDVNSDNIINGRDLAHLKTEY